MDADTIRELAREAGYTKELTDTDVENIRRTLAQQFVADTLDAEPDAGKEDAKRS